MRASPSFPKKTALGLEEMRQRTHGLSQRHRTMLLLVNGKRERTEVLTLAGQAGVGAAMLDELVALGLVDEGRKTPPKRAPEPSPEPPPEPPPVVLAAEPVAPASAPLAPASATVPLPVPAVVTTPPAPQPPPKPSAKARREALPAAPAPSSSTTPREPAPAPAPTARVRATPSIDRAEAASRQTAPVEVRRFDKYPVLTAAKPPAHRSARQVPARAPALADEPAEQRLLAEARTLLIGSLLVEGPVSSSLTVLRVRKARTREELAALVWEIERRLISARRPPEAQARLKRARELLGLGNTIVEGEDVPDEGDTLS